MTYFLHLMYFMLSLMCQSLKDFERSIYSVSACTPIYIVLYRAKSACLPNQGPVCGCHLLSVGMLVPLVTSCMMLAAYSYPQLKASVLHIVSIESPRVWQFFSISSCVRSWDPMWFLEIVHIIDKLASLIDLKPPLWLWSPSKFH